MPADSSQPESVAHQSAAVGQPAMHQAAANPARPSRQDLVVQQRGGPWMAVAVIGCGLLGFATAFFLEIGRRPAVTGVSAGMAMTPDLLAPAAAEPLVEAHPGAGAAAAVGFSGTTPLTEDRYASFADEQAAGFSRFGSAAVTTAVEEEPILPPPASSDQPTWDGASGERPFLANPDLPAPAALPEEGAPIRAPDAATPAAAHAAPYYAGNYAVVTARKPPADVEPQASTDLPMPPVAAAEVNDETEFSGDEVDTVGDVASTPAKPQLADESLPPPASDLMAELVDAEVGDAASFESSLPSSPQASRFGQPFGGAAAPLQDPPGGVPESAEPSAPLPESPSLAEASGEDPPPVDAELPPVAATAAEMPAAATDLPASPLMEPTREAEEDPRGFRVMADVQPGFATPVGQNDPALAQQSASSLNFDDPDAPVAVTPPSLPPFAGGTAPAIESPSQPASAAARYASSDAIRAFGGNLPERPMLPAAVDADANANPGELLPQSPLSAAPSVAENAAPGNAASPSPAFPGAGPGYGVTGVGRPGPPLLEGVQAPQVAVEKRGPREVQVGKFARYEILVRNVSGVTAHDVELFDTVPQGTSLVSTTPPAAPGSDGELAWQLGSLDPGDQARVVVEVLPTDEGEIGSVASVRFAAKASVRSLATRPALSLVIEEPAAMRIGGDVPVTITVSNPGTGRATGVVLEGVLPAGLAHRAGSELEFDIGSLKPGESRSIDLVLATTGPGLHRMDVGVRADGQLEERQTVAVEVTAPTLELTAELPSRRYLQRPATCVLSMANAGTASARSVELAAQLPPGLKFVSANNAGYYDEKNHRVLWQLEELPPAEIGSVEMVLMPIAMGSQQVVAAARSPDGLSDQVAHVLEVEGVAALTFTVVDSEDPIEVDGLTEYVIRVGNQGTKPASNVVVTASMLGDLQPVDAVGPVGHRIENLTISFDPVARLAPTEEAVFRVQARGRRAGDQRVQVQVTDAEQQTPVTKEEVTRVYADR